MKTDEVSQKKQKSIADQGTICGSVPFPTIGNFTLGLSLTFKAKDNPEKLQYFTEFLSLLILVAKDFNIFAVFFFSFGCYNLHNLNCFQCYF